MAAIAVIFGLWNVIFSTYTTTDAGLAIVWGGLAVFGVRRAIE
ncbi:MAG: hypothetical protein U9O94_04235 [Nanoarchaeota archaeon]|nr:hypothetical protein [Nanoarchaeota archaeon]